jgi:2-polyprenyl-3-methyl-5-hydroxy-6-metoxy-1,4-benzoquinol methylase/GNAT superfamily N-acetyltransferase
MTTSRYSYSIVAGHDLPLSQREELKALFDQHYGEWGATGPKPGARVEIPMSKLADLLDRDDAYVLIARGSDGLVGYAIGARVDVDTEPVSWVTQLVVHSTHQNRGIATQLLKSAWAFSDDFAWGLASANPFAIRALEAARFRRCDTSVIAENISKLHDVLPRIAQYLTAPLTVNTIGAAINTDFPVSHEKISSSIAAVSRDAPWTLGDLKDGDEWLAAVFSTQQPRSLTAKDLEELFDAGGSVVAEAYERMAKSAEVKPHPWMRHTASEIDALVELLELRPGASVLDLGCGNGRHSLELAKRGFQVTAVDRSQRWIDQGKFQAAALELSIDFKLGDARDIDLGRTFETVICLYDVVGSFRRDEDNQAIVASIRRHLPVGGAFAISVMNRVVAERLANLKGSLARNPDLVHTIPPSSTMQDTGAIWDPQEYLADTDTGIVYRRERFGIKGSLPVELLVCDRRYRPDELDHVCSAARLDVSLVRPVRLGAWSETCAVDEFDAKELLCVGIAIAA